LNELFRIGRRSRAIGVLLLLVCLFSANFVAGYFAEAPFKIPDRGLGRQLAPTRNLPL
jgi:hypothetical protein